MKRLTRPYILIPLLLILLISSAFWGWNFLPKKPIDILVIDKTVPTDKMDKNDVPVADLRKHKGFFWMLNQQRYVNSKTNTFFNEKKDYYGPYLDSKNKTLYRTLERVDKIPDMVYLTDAYGDGLSDKQNTRKEKNGITLEEVAAVSKCHISGSTIVGEFNILSDPTSEIVRGELERIFGVQYTGWSGKYLNDMSDKTDVPNWIYGLYETQYGEKWAMKGSGIIFVSDKGELVILRAGTDFTGNSIEIAMTKKFSSQYQCKTSNYYNWFEVLAPSKGFDVQANYSFSATKSGDEKLKRAGLSSTFPAIISHNINNQKSIYFAGDFNDYTGQNRFSNFIFADGFYKTFSFDRPGDTTNFYWSFYIPLIDKITKDAYLNSKNIIQDKPHDISGIRINNNKLEINENNKWTTFDIKGFDINGVLPGSKEYQYTQDISVYQNWFKSIAQMGGNSVRAYDLMPPSFYRAIEEHNIQNPKKRIYFYQNISISSDLIIDSFTDTTIREKVNSLVDNTVKAVHGDITVADTAVKKGGIYTSDVSQYLLGYITACDVSQPNVKKWDTKNIGYVFSGTYFSTTAASSPSEGFIASICERVVATEQSTYKIQHPVGALGNQILVPNSPWVSSANNTFLDLSRINTTTAYTAGFFTAYSLHTSDKIYTDNVSKYLPYTDDTGNFAYGGYIKTFKTLQTRYPILIDKFGLPTNMNSKITASSATGVSEYDQGTGIVRMMKAIRKEGYLGGLVYEFSDSWNKISDSTKPFVIPADRQTLWHNALDPEQNYGIMAVESKPDAGKYLSLRQTGIVDEAQITSDETFLYVSLILKEDFDYSKYSMVFGFDTYDRTLGDFIYQKDFLTGSWYGLEYIVKFESKDKASLYVASNYNPLNQKYFSSLSKTGSYDYISTLKYGNFDVSSNNFYHSGASVFMRIPWGSLNFADPSRKMVISDPRSYDQIKLDPAGLQTRYTNGIVFSAIIVEKETKATFFKFSADKYSTGYKVYSWEQWEKPKYQMRLKSSYNIISRYFVDIS